MEEDDGAGGLIERSAGAVEFAFGVWVFGERGFGRAFVEGDAREGGFEAGAAGLEPRGKAEAFAKGFERLVDGKAWVVGGEFEEDAAGLAEVDGVEVFAVEDFGGWKVLGDGGAPFMLGLVVGGAEGDVVDGAGAGAAEVGGGSTRMSM